MGSEHTKTLNSETIKNSRTIKKCGQWGSYFETHIKTGWVFELFIQKW